MEHFEVSARSLEGPSCILVHTIPTRYRPSAEAQGGTISLGPYLVGERHDEMRRCPMPPKQCYAKANRNKSAALLMSVE